ncbi:MAG: hypothetical protein Q9210_005324 [Variospora velana]
MERIETTALSNPIDTSSSLAKRTLIWEACSYRPLSLAELQEALTIDLDRPDFRPAYRYDKETLLEVTARLLYINSDESGVNLCHTTTLEYFAKTQDLWFPKSASKIARCCFQYLNRPALAEPCVGLCEDQDFDKRKSQHAFLAYAYTYWGNHAYDAGDEAKVQNVVTGYLEDTSRVDSFIQAAWYLTSTGSASWDVRKGATSLHVAAWFGLTEAIAHLLDQGSDVNVQNPANDLTPLMCACRRGHVGTAELPLARGASVGIVIILLRYPKLDINEEHLRNAERTALMFAAKDDYVGILGELLDDARTDVNKKDLYGSTALSFAARAGHSASVSRLLQCVNMDVNSVDQNGSSALMHAARNGHEDIVDQLLSSGANASMKDQDGGTALLRAIDNSHTSVGGRMLEYDGVDIRSVDKFGRTLLHGAAVNGYASIDLTARSQQRRHREVVTTLLALRASPTLKDIWDRSPYDVAWVNIQPEFLLILSSKPSDPSSIKFLQENYPSASTLPIWSLATLGNPDLLASALSSRPNSLYHLDLDLLGCIPCTESLLSSSSSTSIIELNPRDEFHQTPLLIA